MTLVKELVLAAAAVVVGVPLLITTWFYIGGIETGDDSGQVVVDGADWGWADYDKPRARVVFASNGAIYSLSCKAPLAKPQKLHDFNSMKYERIKAPY